jgi:sigma-B regulation protein RsbU (phosphoserine phosphatase)
VRFPSLSEWWRYQKFLAWTAIAVYAILWVNRNPGDPLVILVYSFSLGNLNFLAIDNFWLRMSCRGAPYRWLVFLLVELILLPPLVIVSTAIGFVLLDSTRMQPPFWHYVANGWKIPAFMTFLFGTGFAVYRQMEDRLQRRNRELQQAVEMEIAGREQQEQDLERAREIQRALLPREIAQVAGFEVVAAWEPARVVGGDYYDVIRLSDTKLGICIADVVGKGVSAALLMANVQATVRAYASEFATSSWLCSKVNGVLCNNLAADKFVTLFYGVLDAGLHTLQYTNAGHLPPIVMHASGVAESLNGGGAVLGVFPGWKYEDGIIRLSPGDRLLLFTDGITEAMSADGQEFGEAGMLSAARRGADLAPSDLKSHMLVQVNQFCDSQLHDDATLMVIAALASENSRQSAMPGHAAVVTVSQTRFVSSDLKHS